MKPELISIACQNCMCAINHDCRDSCGSADERRNIQRRPGSEASERARETVEEEEVVCRHGLLHLSTVLSGTKIDIIYIYIYI